MSLSMSALRLPVICLLLAGFGPFTCEDGRVTEANEQLRDDAEGALTTLAQVDHDAPEVHLSRAVAHLMQRGAITGEGEEIAAAAKAASEAAAADLDAAHRTLAEDRAAGEPREDAADLQGRVAFARGLVAVHETRWEDAIAEFGQVLRLDPNDEDARWNLELAWYKANPPCPLRDDDHEPDDTRADAPPFDPKKAEDRMLCPADADWYTIPVDPRSFLFVTVEGELHEPDGEQRQVSLSLFAPNDADIPTRTASIKDGKVTVGVRGVRNGGDWKVRVAGPGRAEFKYTLKVEITPPCPADDPLEENDEPNMASALAPQKAAQAGGQGQGQDDGKTLGQKGLRACPDDPDWFRFEVPGGEAREVKVSFDPTRGPLSATLFTPMAEGEPTPVVVGEAGAGGVGIKVPESESPAHYLLRVAADEGLENSYDVEVAPPSDGDGDGDDEKKDDEKKDDEKKDDEKKDDKKKDEPKDDEKKDDEKKDEPKDAEKMDMDQLIRAIDVHEKNPQLEKALRSIDVMPRMEDY